MTIIGNHIKQPIEVFDYDVDYSPEMANTTDFLSFNTEPVITITPQHDGGLEVASFHVNTDSNRIKIWLRNGVDNYDYKVEITTTSNEGRIYQDEFYIFVRNF